MDHKKWSSLTAGVQLFPTISTGTGAM